MCNSQFPGPPEPGEAESILAGIAEVFFRADPSPTGPAASPDKAPGLDARYKVLLDQIPAVVFMASVEEGMGEAYVSPQIEATLGFSREEWLQHPALWYRQIHPEDKDRWTEDTAAMFLTGNPLRSSYRIIAREGRAVWFHCVARLVRRDDGRPWFVHGVGFEITEFKQVQEALREERNVVSAIFDTVGALIIVLDRDGRIVRFNRACERITGYSFADVRNKFIWDLFLPDSDVEEFRRRFLDVRDNLSRTEYESCWIARDGSRKIIALSAAMLPGSKQTPDYVIASGLDVTDQRRADAKFQRLLEAAPDAVVVVDQAGRIVLVNAQVEKLFGYCREELIGAEIEKLVPQRLRDRHPVYRSGFLSQPRVRPVSAGHDLYALHKDGREFPVEIILSPLQTEDGVLVSGAIRDISERKRLEQSILEIREAERQRIGRDLHDGLGQHLTGIAFMARVLQDRLAETSIPEAAEAAKIVALVNDSIRMTRELARGLVPVAPKGRGLVPALKLWAAEISELFQVDCRVECPEPLRLHGEAFAEHLYRLAQEAVNNGIRHGRARIIVVELTLVEGGGALTIRDDGCGFDFASASRSGLGMRTMNDRARVIGGSLNVRSSPTGGTIVRCLFPIPDPAPEESGAD